MLAIALYIDWYTKKGLTDADQMAIKMTWIGKWREKLG
jgi:hypothetical protein